MYSSNFRRFTSFFVPTNKTKGQLGERSIPSILLMPMLLYSAASFTMLLAVSRSPRFPALRYSASLSDFLILVLLFSEEERILLLETVLRLASGVLMGACSPVGVARFPFFYACIHCLDKQVQMFVGYNGDKIHPAVPVLGKLYGRLAIILLVRKNYSISIL